MCDLKWILRTIKRLLQSLKRSSPSSLLPSLAQRELDVIKSLTTDLAAGTHLSACVHDLACQVLSAAYSDEKPSLAKLVCTNLLIRLINDLRSISLLCERSYSPQALTLASSAFESALTIMFIANSADLAKEWTDHENPSQSLRDIPTLIKEGLGKLKVTEPTVLQEFYENYQQMCMSKHGNPLFQRDIGYERTDRVVVFEPGPSTNPFAIREAAFALEKSSQLAILALFSFLGLHVKQNAVWTKLKGELELLDRQHFKLRTDGAERWGTKDPFPGKWKAVIVSGRSDSTTKEFKADKIFNKQILSIKSRLKQRNDVEVGVLLVAANSECFIPLPMAGIADKDWIDSVRVRYVELQAGAVCLVEYDAPSENSHGNVRLFFTNERSKHYQTLPVLRNPKGDFVRFGPSSTTPFMEPDWLAELLSAR